MQIIITILSRSTDPNVFRETIITHIIIKLSQSRFYRSFAIFRAIGSHNN